MDRLKEQWDTTNNKAQDRRKELEQMLAESQEFLEKTRDLERWFVLMEVSLSRQKEVGFTSTEMAKVGEEQKVIKHSLKEINN